MWKWILGIAGTLIVSCSSWVGNSLAVRLPKVEAAQQATQAQIETTNSRLDQIQQDLGKIKGALGVQ